MTDSQVNLKWEPPRQPNGIISFYFIAYTELNDWEYFPVDADPCQFTPVSQDLKLTTRRVVTLKQPESTNEKCNFEAHKPRQPHKLNDYQKNEIISIEDEIYNLAFRPARRPLGVLAKSLRFNNNTLINSNQTTKKIFVQNKISNKTADSVFRFDEDLLYSQFYNLSFNLGKLVRQDLVVQDEEVSFLFQTLFEIFIFINLFVGIVFIDYIESDIECCHIKFDLFRQIHFVGGGLSKFY